MDHHRSRLPAELPSFAFAGPNTLILLLSSFAARQGEKVLRVAGVEGKNTVAAWIAAAALLGAIFVAVQWWEWSTLSFALSTSSYGSIFYTITAFDMIHIAVGMLILLALTLWTFLDYFGGTRSATVHRSANNVAKSSASGHRPLPRRRRRARRRLSGQPRQACQRAQGRGQAERRPQQWRPRQ